MKLITTFRFEFSYLVQQLSTWLYLAVLLTFTIVMDFLITPGDGVYVNNTFHITAMTVIGGFIWLMMGAAIAGDAAARDIRTRMHPLTYTMPVSKVEYLGGRFLAAIAINALLVLSLPLGILLSFYLPGMNEDEFGPFRPSAYLNVYFLIALPNAFIATAIQFSMAALSRQVMTSYMASLLLAIVAQIIAMGMAKLFGNWELVKLLDPVGVAGIVGNEMATWTPMDKNTRLVKLEGMFLWNRVLWLCVAVGSLLFTYIRFNFAETKRWWGRFRRRPIINSNPPAEANSIRASAISVPEVRRNFGFATSLKQALYIARTSFRQIARHRAGFTLVSIIAIVSVVFGQSLMTQFGIPLFPTTQQVLTYLTPDVGNPGSPWVVIPLLIMYFAGELMWRERESGLREIADAAPVPEWALVAGKFMGIGFIIVAWIAILMAAGIGMQLSVKYYDVDLLLYLEALFGLQLIDYLLFALLALVVHVVVNQKYISYLVLLLIFIFIAFASTFKVEHHMLIFGSDPGWSYTDMRGFGSTPGPWLWFKLYWIAWALLLGVAARLLWPRGRAQSLQDRLQSAKRGMAGPTKRVAIIGTAFLVVTGSFIYYNTNVRNEYQDSSDIVRLKAEYERGYGAYSNSLQPQLVQTKLQVDIFPDHQQVKIQAAYTLVNKHTVTIDSIHIGNVSGITGGRIIFSRPATAVRMDKHLSHFIYALKEPLRPGDSLQMQFGISYKPEGFRNSGSELLVVKNGTYFTNYDLLPAIGYQPYRELKDATLRKKNKLASRPAIPSLYDPKARLKSLSPDQTTLEVIVSTVKDEVAIAPGNLYQTWITGDRRYFHYKTDGPIGGEYSILSANYAVAQSKWNDVAISIYFHPDHQQNISRILNSVKASLAYYTEQFGRYPYSQITVAERAGPGGGATADAGIIYYGEQYAVLNPDEGPNGFDLPYYILAHEMAHQWWGVARLSPAYVEGAGVLIEGLAVYSGMKVLEKNYGDAHLRKYVNYLHASYEMPRSLATASLLQADEDFLYYRKGGLAMYALSKYIGTENVNAALRTLLGKRDSGSLPFPTTIDLYDELQKVTPDSLTYLLNDLFKENTYWRLKTKQLAVTLTRAGSWEVTMKVEAQKLVIDRVGNEKEVPMNDWLEVGLYEEGRDLSKPLYLQKHRVLSGEQTIKVTVPRKPDRGGIDPNYLMIDLRLDDNIIEPE
ncbi:ABC transporter permease/M1 family aminopeptidase [Flavitalea antarctica]